MEYQDTGDLMYKSNPAVLFTDLGDGTSVLLHMGTRFYFTLNETGTKIWKTLEVHEDGTTPDHVAGVLTTMFDNGPSFDTVLRDIEEMFAEMLKEEILVRV